MNEPQQANNGYLVNGTLYIKVSETSLCNHYNQWAEYYKQLTEDIARYASKESNTLSYNLDYYCGCNYSIINQHLRKGISSEYNPWIERAHFLIIIRAIMLHTIINTVSVILCVGISVSIIYWML